MADLQQIAQFQQQVQKSIENIPQLDGSPLVAMGTTTPPDGLMITGTIYTMLSQSGVDWRDQPLSDQNSQKTRVEMSSKKRKILFQRQASPQTRFNEGDQARLNVDVAQAMANTIRWVKNGLYKAQTKLITRSLFAPSVEENPTPGQADISVPLPSSSIYNPGTTLSIDVIRAASNLMAQNMDFSGMAMAGRSALVLRLTDFHALSKSEGNKAFASPAREKFADKAWNPMGPYAPYYTFVGGAGDADIDVIIVNDSYLPDNTGADAGTHNAMLYNTTYAKYVTFWQKPDEIFCMTVEKNNVGNPVLMDASQAHGFGREFDEAFVQIKLNNFA